MEVTEQYELPFESEFDWRVSMFHIMKDFYNEALVEVVSAYKEKDEGFEWKDDDNILMFASEKNLFDKACELAKTKASNHFRKLYG